MCRAWPASRTCRAPRSQSEYTATVGIPSSRHARMPRTAISPRLATRTFTTLIVCGPRGPCELVGVIGRVLQRNVAVLPGRVLVALGLEAGQCGDEFRAGLAGVDDLVDEPARRRDVGIGELLAEFLDARAARGLRVGGLVDLALVQDVDRPLRPHHRDLRPGPREVHVGANVL